MTRKARGIGALIAAGAVVLLLAACSSGGGVAESVEKGLPPGWNESELGDPGLVAPVVGWVAEGERFAVVTWGSSGCPPVAESIEAEADDALKVVFGPPEHEVCTADFAPTSFVFALPREVTERPISVTLEIEWVGGEVERVERELE